MNKDNKMIDKLIEIDKQMKEKKPFLFEKFQPNGDIAYSKCFETLDEALEFYEEENGWWFQCISVNGKIIKHNNEKVEPTEVEN